MKRREFISRSTAAAIGAGIAGPANLFGAAPGASFDKYGGWTGIKFKATGFFRVEKADRWWIVSPEGNAFLSFGINHLVPDLFKQDFHREQMLKIFGLDDFRDYAVYSKALRKWFLQTCKDFGFNTAGVHTSLQTINNPRPAIPYMQPIHFMDIPHWKGDIPDSNFKDMFSKEYALHCDGMAREIAGAKRDDPYLFGYAMTDCPLFTEEDCRERPDTIGGARRGSRIGFPRKFRNLDDSAPAKQVYVKTMQKIYEGKIGKFNKTYGTRFKSFDELGAAVDWRKHTDLSNGNETRDNVEFLKVCVAKYYEVGRDAIRKYDDNHMFLGDKIHANTDSIDTVLPATHKYTDIVMYQMYAKFEVQEPGLDRWAKITDKPFLNGDSAYTMVTEDMPRPYGPIADTLEQRAEWTKEFMEKAFARPDFVGWHYCGLIDATMKHPRKQDRQHSGLIDQYGNPYPILQSYIKKFTGEMYQVATSRI